jgi:hypothetical protein
MFSSVPRTAKSASDGLGRSMPRRSIKNNKKSEQEGSLTMKVYVVREDESPPYCKGCWNEKGDCGTPCQSCKKKDEWDCYVLRIFTRKKQVRKHDIGRNSR